jgi:KipI family sensor histidine kinase inhibitor
MIFRKYHIGDACYCWQLGDTIDESTSQKTLAVYRYLKDANHPGVLDVVPSYHSVAVYLDMEHEAFDDLENLLDSVIAGVLRDYREASSSNHGSVTIPVRYDGPDLTRVAESNGFGRREVIELHTSGHYVVAMIGFLPHFPYLIGLNPRIATPRLENPRTRVPAGSVAIGGKQTGIYPAESPGGWNVIGRCDPTTLTGLIPGDRIEFQETI